MIMDTPFVVSLLGPCRVWCAAKVERDVEVHVQRAFAAGQQVAVPRFRGVAEAQRAWGVDS